MQANAHHCPHDFQPIADRIARENGWKSLDDALSNDNTGQTVKGIIDTAIEEYTIKVWNEAIREAARAVRITATDDHSQQIIQRLTPEESVNFMDETYQIDTPSILALMMPRVTPPAGNRPKPNDRQRELILAGIREGLCKDLSDAERLFDFLDLTDLTIA